MTTRPATQWRIAQLDDLRHHPRNLATHDERNHAVVGTSLDSWGQVQNLVIQSGTGVVIAGNCRLDELRELGEVSAMVCEVDCTDDEADRLAAVLNRSEELRSWSVPDLAATLQRWRAAGEDLAAVGWNDSEFKAAIKRFENEGGGGSGTTKGNNDLPALRAKAVSKVGEVYQLGRHRLICGDSTDPLHLAELMGDDVADLVSADPPYGMGKEADGVANDNLRRSKLDAFQLAWWSAWRAHVDDAGSAYVWGVAEDLWRLWFNGLGASEPEINVRNEIVWAKDQAQGKRAEAQRMMPPETERCLLIMLRRQSIGNVNTEDFPDSFAPLLDYLESQRAIMGWGPKATREITGSQMHSHWFSRSQWALPTAEQYGKLQAAADGAAFLRPHGDLQSEYAEGEHGLLQLRREFEAQRGYFDNSHDDMTDVWRFPAVSGEERHGHPTPKPVEMIERVIMTSSPEGAIVAVPFGGSCPEIIACERLGRTARIAELQPVWCDAIRRRWTAWCVANGRDPGPGMLD